jgi:hypothetical protein
MDAKNLGAMLYRYEIYKHAPRGGGGCSHYMKVSRDVPLVWVAFFDLLLWVRVTFFPLTLICYVLCVWVMFSDLSIKAHTMCIGYIPEGPEAHPHQLFRW